MFTSKKDEEIEGLQAQIMTLNMKVKSMDQSWLDCRIASEKKDTKILILKKEMGDMQEYYSGEDSRLRRMVASEKKRRLNNINANERKIQKLVKALEAQETKA